MVCSARSTPIVAAIISTRRRLARGSRKRNKPKWDGLYRILGSSISAYSPQARGRSERVFGTLQGRLPKDLRLAGIRTVEAANAWLKAHYMAEHNAAFAIKAEQQGTAFVADRHQAWREALCVIEERTVANDNTIAWDGRRLQLPESRLRPHFVKAVVRVHGYPDGTVSVFLGPHRLARFAADGQQISPDAPNPGSVLGAVKDKPLRA